MTDVYILLSYIEYGVETPNIIGVFSNVDDAKNFVNNNDEPTEWSYHEKFLDLKTYRPAHLYAETLTNKYKIFKHELDEYKK